jgi:pimeloyl-ACP methyl ester carboxylesterase
MPARRSVPAAAIALALQGLVPFLVPSALARETLATSAAAYRAAFSAERLGEPPPSAALATEFTLGYRGLLPHAAFAVARDPMTGRSAWGYASGAPSPEAATTAALERCGRALRTLQAECRILARDGEVEGAAAMIQPVQGSLGPFRWSPLHLRRGPEAARGAVVWGHGYGGPDRDNRSRPVPGFVSILNDAGWDVLRFDRHPGGDLLTASLPLLLEGLDALRDAGYRRITLGGHSRGGWQAVLAGADRPELIQAVIATAPAAHGETGRPNNLGVALDDFRRLLAGLPAEAPRVLIALFDADEYDPDPQRRADAVEAAARDRQAPLLALWPRHDIRSHQGATDWRFARFYGGCLLTFVQAPAAAVPRGLRRDPCGGG